MKWEILDTSLSSPEENMRIERELLINLETSQKPVLHLFEFENNSATFGHFIDPFTHLKREGVEKRGVKLAKRPTGGGILFHLWDFTFSLTLPASHPAFSRNPLENYALVNAWVSQIITSICPKTATPKLLKEKTDTNPFCMAKPTIYDVLLEGKKIGGAAQRCTKFGLLHQGSIALVPPSLEFLNDVLQEEQVLQQMKQNSISLFPQETPLPEIRAQLKKIFSEEIQRSPFSLS